MIKTMKRKTIHLFGACALLLASCTNLDPDIYSDMTIDKILEDSEQSSAYLLTPMYGQMRWFNEDRSIWDLTELGTDAWVIPTNSDGGWYDGGIWLRLDNHEWKSTDPHFSTCWSHLWYGITTCCNRVLHQFEEAGLELDEQTLAEVRAVRAFYYYYLLSLSGMCRSWRPTTCQKIICRRRATGKRCMISSCGNCARAWTNCPKNSGTVVLTSGQPSICWQRYI